MYEEKEVYESTLKYFDGDELATQVWMNKYCLKDSDGSMLEKTPDDMHRRLAREVARIENKYPNPLSEEELYELFKDFKYIVPQGGSMYGIGNDVLASLSNCFVIGDSVDSYGNIMNTDHEQVQLMKRRGGVGHDLSHIRPKGHIVNNSAGSSSGVVPYMDRYSNSTREVAQNGRNGALMLSIGALHPDAEDFIDAKLDMGKVTGANISIKAYDRFIEAALNNKPIPSEFNGKTYGDIDAKKLFDKVVYNAWKSAEPGSLFWDRIINESPARGYGKEWGEKSTNPCVHKDTLILTSDGYIPIKDTVGKEVSVWNGKRFSPVVPAITGKTNTWFNIEFSDGSELKCTPYHKFYIKDKVDHVEAKNLSVGDKLQKYSFPVIEGCIDYDLYVYGYYYIYIRKDFVPGSNFSVKSRLSFLAGLIDYNGLLNGIDGSVDVVSENKKILADVKYMLNTLGVDCTLSTIEEDQTTYYKLIVSATSVERLMDLGLNTHRVKLLASPNRDTSRFVYIKSITVEEVEGELTYCFTEEEEHKGVFNGVLTGQCGELPLPPYDSCRLLVINLLSYVTDPFSDTPSLNLSLLEDHVHKARRIIDDIIDLEVEKIDGIIDKIDNSGEPESTLIVERELWKKIRQKAIDGRRTGLGITAEGDMMAALDIRYGSDASVNFVGEIHQFIGTQSYIASVGLAKERGAFPIWNYRKDQESDFIKRVMSKDNILMTQDVLDDYILHGRRGIGDLTIAPTGTVSLMTRTTSGIENLFFPWHYRKKKTGDKTKATITDEVGDMWEEYLVVHKPFVQWYSVYSGCSMSEANDIISSIDEEDLKNLFKKSPYYKATAQDVDYINKVKMQGAAQKWVDHSISVTVNMPESATVDTVKDVYIEAYKSGCKGVTVYREGSRLGVLNTSKSEETNSGFDYAEAFKRPKVVDHEVYFKKALGDEYIFFVGIVNGKPYEIMGVPYSKDLGMPRSVKKGKVTKIGKGHYRFESERGFVIENIIPLMNETEQHQTRSWSLMLRHRIDPYFIIKDVKSYASIVSFEKAVANVLGNYVVDETVNKCPECGSEVTMADGCLKCSNCGYSKCG